jgi:DNA-binding CsgD family transcriptional regulator/PAS domain-containing protein
MVGHMTGPDSLLAVIEAIYAAGLDAELWPQALAGMARAVGGGAATLEVYDKPSLRPVELYCHGVPPASEIKYLDHYVTLNRRLPIVARDPLGEMNWDYRIFDEQTISRDPFYMEFLASFDVKYWVGGIVLTNRDEFAGVCVHRSPKQGHVDKAGLALMERFLPHVKGAFDVTRRLKGAGDARHALERALDWLADGVILVRTDGAVVYANEAFQAIVRRGDGVRTKKSVVEFAAADARSRFETALSAAQRPRNEDPRDASADFPVARPSGAPTYLVSVRPVPGNRRDSRIETSADAIVFIRDPLSRNAAAIRMLREVFGLTDAEASLAQALQAGVPYGEYAQARAVSLNTVYTHLRRIKEKTGCRRMAELIRKLNHLQVPLRVD